MVGKRKLISIESGDDWYDAGYKLLTLPAGANLARLARLYRKSPLDDLDFDEWLVRHHGAEWVEAETVGNIGRPLPPAKPGTMAHLLEQQAKAVCADLFEKNGPALYTLFDGNRQP